MDIKFNNIKIFLILSLLLYCNCLAIENIDKTEVNYTPRGGNSNITNWMNNHLQQIDVASVKQNVASIYDTDYYKLIHKKITENLYKTAHVVASAKMVAEVTIDKNGNLLSYSILQTSDVEKLDRAFQKAIKKSAPFDIFPPEIDEDVITVKISVFYSVRFQPIYGYEVRNF